MLVTPPPPSTSGTCIALSTVLIKGNTVVNSDNGLRVKTQVGAKSGSVSNVTYDGNTITGASKYGVVIQQGAFKMAHCAKRAHH